MRDCNHTVPQTAIIHTTSPEETERIGNQIGALLQAGDLVLLSGTLGAGKTCLTRGLAQGWGAKEQPTSPTFTLINEYHKGDETFYHADCYRLEGTSDAISTGIDDLFWVESVLVIEWPERIEQLLPDEYLLIKIEEEGPDNRRLTLSGCGARAESLVGSLKQS